MAVLAGGVYAVAEVARCRTVQTQIIRHNIGFPLLRATGVVAGPRQALILRIGQCLDALDEAAHVGVLLGRERREGDR